MTSVIPFSHSVIPLYKIGLAEINEDSNLLELDSRYIPGIEFLVLNWVIHSIYARCLSLSHVQTHTPDKYQHVAKDPVDSTDTKIDTN